jgi:hypothetical protein
VGEIAVLSSKGAFVALFAFFALMPLGHMTIGVLFVIIGLFYPGLPASGEHHDVKLGSDTAKLEIKGSPRTLLAGIGAFVIFLSFAEMAVR